MKEITALFNNKTLVTLAEALFVTAGVVFVIHYFSMTNYFLEGYGFPWLWLLPLAFSLRYGSKHGLLSYLIIGLSSYSQFLDTFAKPESRLFFLGGFLLTLLGSYFHSHWYKRIAQLQEIQSFFEIQLQKLVNNYNLLMQSHDRLETNLISNPYTLRQALIQLSELAKKSQEELTSDLAHEFLNLLSYYTHVQSAALYKLSDAKLSYEPIASIGTLKPLYEEDILVNRALKEKKTVYISEEKHALSEKQTDYLAVIPIQTSHTMLALLCIKHMPFWAFNETTLKTVVLLSDFFANILDPIQTGNELLKLYPHCPSEFAGQFYQLVKIYKSIGKDSAIIFIKFYSHPKRNHIIHRITHEKRDFDSLWLIEEKDFLGLMIQMPFSNRSSVLSYFARINKILVELQYPILGESPTSVGYVLLSEYADPIQAIKYLMEIK